MATSSIGQLFTYSSHTGRTRELLFSPFMSPETCKVLELERKYGVVAGHYSPVWYQTAYEQSCAHFVPVSKRDVSFPL